MSPEVTPRPKTQTPKKPAKRIPWQSKKRRALQPTRKQVRELVLENAGHRCEYEALIPEVKCGPVGLRTQLEVDEIRGGSYRNLEWLDPLRCHATCPAHHDFKTAHKNEVIRRLEAAT